MKIKIYLLSALTLALQTYSTANAAELLHVNKQATLCTAPSTCGYNNPTFRMNCSFNDSGVVSIAKIFISSMVAPATPIPAMDAVIVGADLVQLITLSKTMAANPTTLSQEKRTGGRLYIYFGDEYAASDSYRIPTPGASDDFLEVAAIFRHEGGVMPNPEAVQLVDLADKYCVWSLLTPISN